MNERRSGFTPRIRPKEEIPEVPTGKELTRVDGKLIIVTAKDINEPYYGNSQYTLRQICEIYHAKVLNEMKKLYGSQ